MEAGARINLGLQKCVLIFSISARFLHVNKYTLSFGSGHSEPFLQTDFLKYILQCLRAMYSDGYTAGSGEMRGRRPGHSREATLKVRGAGNRPGQRRGPQQHMREKGCFQMCIRAVTNILTLDRDNNSGAAHLLNAYYVLCFPWVNYHHFYFVLQDMEI